MNANKKIKSKNEFLILITVLIIILPQLMLMVFNIMVFNILGVTLVNYEFLSSLVFFFSSIWISASILFICIFINYFFYCSRNYS